MIRSPSSNSPRLWLPSHPSCHLYSPSLSQAPFFLHPSLFPPHPVFICVKVRSCHNLRLARCTSCPALLRCLVPLASPPTAALNSAMAPIPYTNGMTLVSTSILLLLIRSLIFRGGPLLQRICPSLLMKPPTSLRPTRASHSRLLSTRPSRRHSRISHRRLLAAIPSHRPIRLPHLRTRTMPGTSSPTTSHGVMNTKSIVRGYCRAQRATAFSCAPQRLCATSAPRKLAKNVVSARQRYVLSPYPSLATVTSITQSVKCTGTRPSCARCASRDYLCEYASEVTSEPTNSTKARRPRRETREPAQKDSGPPSPLDRCIKAEIPEFLSLHYSDHTGSYWEGSTPSDDCSMEEPWQFNGGILPDATTHSLVRRPSIAAPHPVRHNHPQSLSAPLATHGDARAVGIHAQIQLPLLPHFGMPGQRLMQHEVYAPPEVKYEQSVAFGPHSYDP